MACTAPRASVVGRLVALAAVVHSAVIVFLAAVALGSTPVAAPDPALAVTAAAAHITALGLTAAAIAESSDFSGTSMLMVYIDGLAATACVLVGSLLRLAGSAGSLTLPCVLLAGLVSAAHATIILLIGVGVVSDDLSWTLRRPAELTPGAKVKILQENCCGCRSQHLGVLQRQLDADD